MKRSEMKLERKIITKSVNTVEADDGFVDADRASLFAMVWEITRDLWAFSGGEDAERRLQRNVVNIIRRES